MALRLDRGSDEPRPRSAREDTGIVRREPHSERTPRESLRETQVLRAGPALHHVLGEHPAMQHLIETVAQIAPSRATVLIRGESGTGKELIASAIHQNSPRRHGPFVRLHCAALAASVLESELFGHEKGAFTGAIARREGRFKHADGGTLFLDEVSEIPLEVQVKLLRFLQERQFERVGGNCTLGVDVRVVAATNRDLRASVKLGAFREDLFYRLNVVELDVPPLRARRSDIPLLAQHFLACFADENAAPARGFTDDCLRAMLAHDWPGNVRELENAVERAVVMCRGPQIERALLPFATGRHGPDAGSFPPGRTLAELERHAILNALASVGGSTARAAEELGVSQRKIQYRLKQWGLTHAFDTEGA